MTSLLVKFYPYKPRIDSDGNIDLTSIHTKKSEIGLTLATTALSTAILFRKASYKWPAVGAVTGALSYLFWSRLGQSIPQEIADQACIQEFLTSQNTIPDGIAKRVLANDSLNDQIYARIISITNPTEKNLCLEFYFFGLWKHATNESQKQLFAGAVESSCISFLTFLDKAIDKNSEFLGLIGAQERFNIWKSAQTGHAVKTLTKTFDIKEKYDEKTILETYAAEAVQKQDNQERCNSIITSMNILLKYGASYSIDLDLESHKIKRDSALERLIGDNTGFGNAESLLKKLLSK